MTGVQTCALPICFPVTIGVDGLIHISDLSWTKKVKHPSEFTQIGAEIDVQVLEIDKANRRLSLGHKQLEENPWDVLETMFTIDSVHEGVIIEMMDKGAVISLPYGVEGFATPKHLVKEDGSQAQIDDKLQFKVIEFNKDAKRIIVSHSRIHEDVKRAEKSETVVCQKVPAQIEWCAGYRIHGWQEMRTYRIVTGKQIGRAHV